MCSCVGNSRLHLMHKYSPIKLSFSKFKGIQKETQTTYIQGGNTTAGTFADFDPCDA